MGNIHFNIIRGVPLFKAELIPSTVPALTGLPLGMNMFENVPYDVYTLRITDSVGCIFDIEDTIPECLACSCPYVFEYAMSSISVNNKIFLGERKQNPNIIIFDDLDNLYSYTTVNIDDVGSVNEGLESCCYSSITGRIYFSCRDNNTGLLCIIDFNPGNLSYSKNVITGVSGTNAVIVTGEGYIYGANNTKFFKIRISDWQLMQSNIYSDGFTTPHGIEVNTSRRQYYVSTYTLTSMLAVLDIDDLSNVDYIDLTTHVSFPTDDLTYYDDGGTCKIYIAGQLPLGGGGAVSVEITNGNLIDDISLLPSYGLWRNGVDIYNAAISKKIQKFDISSPENVITYDLDDWELNFIPNEIIFSSDRMFLTKWGGIEVAKICEWTCFMSSSVSSTTTTSSSSTTTTTTTTLPPTTTTTSTILYSSTTTTTTTAIPSTTTTTTTTIIVIPSTTTTTTLPPTTSTTTTSSITTTTTTTITRTFECSATDIFVYAHSSIVLNNIMFIGERKSNPQIVRFNNPDDLSDYDVQIVTGVGSAGQGLESVCYSSITGKLYFGAKYTATGNLAIVEVNTTTLAYTLHIIGAPVPINADLFVITTDSTYIYGGTQTIFFKIRISDWVVIQVEDFTSTGFADSHGIAINVSRNQLYVTSQYDISMLAIVNINDLSDYDIVSLVPYVSHPTDDMTYYDDGLLCRIFVVGEYDVTNYGGAYIDVTNGNSVTGINMLPSLGLWVHNTCVYSASRPNSIQVFTITNPVNLFTYPINDVDGLYRPNEIMFIGDRLFVTKWAASGYAKLCEFDCPCGWTTTTTTTIPSGLRTLFARYDSL